MDSGRLRELILEYVPELKDADKNTNKLSGNIGNKLRIKFLKKQDGFCFYSDVELNKEEHFIGPWLKERLTDCFSQCGFTKVCFAKRGERMGDKSAVEASCVEVSFDLDELNKTDNGEDRLLKGLDKAKKFLDKWVEIQNSDESDRILDDIRHYNTSNAMVIESYKNDFGHRRPEPSIEPDGGKTGRDSSHERLKGQIRDLLESNLQVILTGAPGTGKTYTARQVAEKMITEGLSSDDEKKEAMDKRFKSVQFHPGYDYSDFVIGMKPVLVSDDGREVFKDDAGLLYTTDDGKKDGKKTPFSGKTNVSFLWKDGVFKKFADNARKDMNHTFVFLIDEINRADLSRVFGELFSLLEEEYRYPNNQKGITLPNGETFHIPANLCIIGTMNDIDRSVESMDFALRRRFAWKEIRAKDTQADILEKVPAKDDLIAKMDAVNAIIEKELGQEYELGAAIFEKFKKCNSFDELWANHIEIILNEYLRGRHNRQVLQDDLKNAFSSTASHAPETNSGDNDAKTPSIGQN